MKIAIFPQRNTVDETHLQQAGFSVEEILQLIELRQSYPVLETLESRHQYQWLKFMRWCYQTGRVHE